MEILFEGAKYHDWLGVAPFEDGLVEVANHGQVAASPAQVTNDLVLSVLGVLHLVHLDEVVALCPPFADRGVRQQAGAGAVDKIREVKGMPGAKGGMVALSQGP